MNLKHIAEVAVLIVGFRNPADISHCLAALSLAVDEPSFDVFICENGGAESFHRLLEELLTPQGACQGGDGRTISTENCSRFVDIRHLRFRARASNIWVGCATGNLGYAGGINAWLQPLLSIAGWKGVWVLNPDTEPETCALAALVARAESGKKGMVGSTILDVGEREIVRFRGGLHWQRFAARPIALGLGERLKMTHDLAAVEAAMDSPSGASMYVTRSCIGKIGLMDERYFLFFEDLDWGLRAKSCGLGYACASIVWHRRGTTTGSAKSLEEISRLSIYLEHRNGIHLVLRFFPWTLPLRIFVSFLYAIRFLVNRAPNNFIAALKGIWAGVRGEVGVPIKYHELSGIGGFSAN